METIPAGRPLVDCIKLCYAAKRPPLLIASHGVGKSQLLEQSAREMGIDYIVRDLSLMEPVDLIGLPKLSTDCTIYLPPKFLPTKGKGLLVFEELNRCETCMRAPCLQLLTTWCLNDYRLPDGWLTAAAVNPADEDYEVADLDAALLSRFTQFRVVPDRVEWLAWAHGAGTEPSVIRYVQDDATVFDDPASNPRAWEYVSDLVKAADHSMAAAETLKALIMGTVGDERGIAFCATLTNRDRSLHATDVIEAYKDHKWLVARWLASGRIDMLRATLLDVLKHLQPQDNYQRARRHRKHWANISQFLTDLPGDLKAEARQFFDERGYDWPGGKI